MRLLWLLFLCEAAAAYDCPPMTNISYGGIQYSYPPSDDYHYGKNLHCVWTINIPIGMYATVTANAYLTLPGDGSDIVNLNTDYRKTATLTDRVTDYKFDGVGSTINITLTSNPSSVGTFSFTVDWYTYVQRFSYTYPFAANSYVVFNVDNELGDNTAVTITTENTTKIAISFDDDMSTSEIVVYDGNSTNETFLGVLANLFQRDHPFSSTGNSMTLLYPLPSFNRTSASLLANDNANVANFSHYWFDTGSSVTEDLKYDGSAVTLHYGSPTWSYTLAGISYYNKYNCEISINVGPPTRGAAVIATYRSTVTDNSTYPFPQQLVNGMITLRNNAGLPTVMFGPQSDTTLIYGRTGYVFSNNYGTNTTQFVNQTFVSAEKSTAGIMTLAIVYADLQDNVTCQITIGSNVFGCAKIGTNVTMNARSFSVLYDSNKKINGGLKLAYSFIEGTQSCPPRSNIYYNGIQYVYPQTGDDHYGINLNCLWTINIPSGMYATVTVNALLSQSDGTSDSVRIETDYGKATTLTDRVADFKFNGVGSTISITLTSNSSSYGTFSFSVDWYQQVQRGSKSYSFPANSYEVIDVQNELSDNKAVTLTTENTTKIAISVDLSDSAGELLVFDGNSTNATFRGVLANLYSDYKPFCSTGNSLTFLYPLPPPNNLTGKFIANDKANVANLSAYYFNNGEGDAFFPSENSAATLYADSTDSYYFLSAPNLYNIPCNFSVNVGAPTSGAAVIATYRSNTSLWFPQQMVNGILTIRSNEAGQEVKLATQCDNDTVLYFGRKGYVFSNNYATNTAQFVNKTFVSSDNTAAGMITFGIDYADLNDKVACQLTIGNDVLNCTNIGMNVTMSGQTFNVLYDSHQTINGGLKLTYSFARDTLPSTSTRKATTTTTRPQTITTQAGSLPRAFYCALIIIVPFMWTS